jgi:DNA-nicking Smr family endonuclease
MGRVVGSQRKPVQVDGRDRSHALQQTGRFAARPGAKVTARAGRTDSAAGRRTCGDNGEVKLKLDLHDIYNRGDEIEHALRAIIAEAVAKKAPLVEIIPGKGSGQLKKRVLRFLDQKEVKALYHRVEKDSDNFGRVFVHFRWK